MRKSLFNLMNPRLEKGVEMDTPVFLMLSVVNTLHNRNLATQVNVCVYLRVRKAMQTRVHAFCVSLACCHKSTRVLHACHVYLIPEMYRI